MDAALAGAAEPTWRETRPARGRGYLRWWEERPEFSRAYLVEVPAAGPRAVEQRDRASEPFVELVAALAARTRREEPHLPPLPDLAARLLTLGITELLAREVRAGRIDRLLEIAPDLEEVIVGVLGGMGTPTNSRKEPRRDRPA